MDQPTSPPPAADDTSRAVAWVVEGDEVYGVAQMILCEALALAGRGWRVTIVSLKPGAFVENCRDAGLSVVVLDVGPSPKLTRGFLRDVLALWAIKTYQRRAGLRVIEAVRDLRIDAINVAWPNLLGVAGRAAHDQAVPCFWEMPNAVGSRWWGLNQWIYQRQCQHYGVTPLAISRYAANTIGDRLVAPVVRYLGVDAGRFDPDQIDPVPRQKLGIPENAFVLGICARIGTAKGQDIVLQAMLRQDDAPRPLHLLLLGGPIDGSFADALRETADRVGASDRLHMPGPVTVPQRYYEAIDVAINARPDPEPFGLSVVEAMMMRTPVLVHALGGPAETIVDGVTGWHVHAATVDAFADGLRRALIDQPRWAEMGEAARQQALQRFTLDHSVDHYIRIVEHTLTSAAAPPDS